MQWAIDPTHTHIQFQARHLGISTVRGTFDKLSGSVAEENGQFTGADIEVDVASLNTGQQQRDDHLRSPDFFDVATYPTARFTLTEAVRTGDRLEVRGTLTLRGITKPITLAGDVGGPAKDPWGNTKISATLTGEISRKEWGLTWNQALEAGGVLVSDAIKLAIDVQAAPQG